MIELIGMIFLLVLTIIYFLKNNKDENKMEFDLLEKRFK